MINKQLKKLVPTKLRIMLLLSIALTIIAGSAGFWLFRDYLISFSGEVKAANASATESSDNIIQLKMLQTELNNDKVAVTRAKNIVAGSKYYQYQNQIIDDIDSYGQASGVTITGFTFNNENVTGGTKPPVGSAATPVGLKTTTAIISIQSPVSYHSVMNFLHAIELNLTRMDITGVSMSNAKDANQVTVNPISIEVYTR